MAVRFLRTRPVWACHTRNRPAATKMPGDTMDPTLRRDIEQLPPVSFSWALACCAFRRDEAEDVLQTVYFKLFEGRARYHGRSSLRTWLFAVIRNTAADRRRQSWCGRSAPISSGKSACCSCQALTVSGGCRCVRRSASCRRGSAKCWS